MGRPFLAHRFGSFQIGGGDVQVNERIPFLYKLTSHRIISLLGNIVISRGDNPVLRFKSCRVQIFLYFLLDFGRQILLEEGEGLASVFCNPVM